MQRELNAYFEDTLTAIEKIERYTKGMSKEEFSKDEMIIH